MCSDDTEGDASAELVAELAKDFVGGGEAAPASSRRRADWGVQYIGEREKQRRRMAAKRAAARDIIIPAVKNERRRRKCSRHIEYALRTWWPELYFDPFNAEQQGMIHSILDAATHGIGTKIGIAAPRGWGKTSIFKGVAIYAITEGVCSYPVIIEATGPFGERTLLDMKRMIERSDPLLEDYPEVVAPIRALEGAPQRARSQIFGGKLTGLIWSGRFCVFAAIPGSKASGAVMTALGIDGAIRGLVFGSFRPDLALINDPETRETIKSRLLTSEREATIDNDIGFLEGRRTSMVSVFLGTITKPGCLADTYTDPKEKPAGTGSASRSSRRCPTGRTCGSATSPFGGRTSWTGTRWPRRRTPTIWSTGSRWTLAPR